MTVWAGLCHQHAQDGRDGIFRHQLAQPGDLLEYVPDDD